MTVRLRPLIKPDGRISRIRLSEPLHHKAFGRTVELSLPRYPHRQSPQTVTVVQQLVGIIAPQRLGAIVFAPQPAAQPVSHPVLGLAEHTRALPIVEIPTPAPQQLVQVIYRLGYAP